MKRTLARHCAVALLLGAAVAGAQVVVPATPRKFAKRSIGTSGSGSAVGIDVVTPPEPPKVTHTRHVELSETRQWQSADGRTLLGKLIAFEDVTAETTKGAPVPELQPPPNPTVIKDGKVRLLVRNKPYVLPLERLSPPDRQFVETLRTGLAGKAEARQ